MEEPKKGGARQGSGRKPLSANEKTVALSARVTESQRKQFIAMGGAAWLRGKIDEYTASQQTA